MNENTEREKMLSGALYNPADPELVEARLRARDLVSQLNSRPARDLAARQQIAAALFGSVGKNLWIEPPFACDYGHNISFGDNVFLNFNVVMLDCGPIRIGSNVLVGPAVQFYAATHPLDADTRRTGLEYGSSITVEDDVWIGGGAIILPGVTIARGSVIAAGSVVTRDVPPAVVVAGNPARVLRPTC